ncbi:hypothetical protein [Streptomyces sp. NPDC055134]
MAICFRFGFSPGASLMRIAWYLSRCVFKVAGRRASGRMTMPLLSTWVTSAVDAVAGMGALATSSTKPSNCRKIRSL